SNASNATLSSPSAATLTIVDNDDFNITATSLVRANDPERVLLLPLGEAQVDLSGGAIRISQTLDMDISPGTDVGRNPMLVYNSATVSVRPIIKILLTTDPLAALPDDVQLRLTFNGVTDSWKSFDLTGHTPGDVVVLAVQRDDPVA